MVWGEALPSGRERAIETLIDMEPQGGIRTPSHITSAQFSNKVSVGRTSLWFVKERNRSTFKVRRSVWVQRRCQLYGSFYTSVKGAKGTHPATS
eukprot:scaffold1525_cov142-Cylindrotheca_fusiformis.AAC.200